LCGYGRAPSRGPSDVRDGTSEVPRLSSFRRPHSAPSDRENIINANPHGAPEPRQGSRPSSTQRGSQRSQSTSRPLSSGSRRADSAQNRVYINKDPRPKPFCNWKKFEALQQGHPDAMLHPIRPIGPYISASDRRLNEEKMARLKWVGPCDFNVTCCSGSIIGSLPRRSEIHDGTPYVPPSSIALIPREGLVTLPRPRPTTVERASIY